MLQDVDGKVLFKLRQRRGSVRVYDNTMRFVGRVRITDAGVSIEPFPEGPVIHSVLEGVVVQAAGYFRLEQMAVGWTVFDGNAQLVGYIAKEGERWNFREEWGGEPTVYAEKASHGMKLTTGTLVSATSDRLTPVMGLVGSLNGLTPLAQASLGLWLENFSDRVTPPIQAQDLETLEELTAPPPVEGAE